MPSLGEDFSRALSLIAQAEDVYAIRMTVMEALALAGIPAAYFLAPLTSDARVGRILTSIGNSRIWERHYRTRLHLVDPLPQFSLQQSGAFFWPDTLELEDLSRRERRYLEISAKHGLGRGVGVACYGPQGRSGFLGAVWTQEEPPGQHVLQWVNFVGQSSFQRYCQLVRKDDLVPALSNRELEVLSWMCEGKSNSVIAQILEISRSSVDMYVRRLFSKLEVTDRTAACVKGFSLGLTVGRDYLEFVERTRRGDPGNAIRPQLD